MATPRNGHTKVAAASVDGVVAENGGSAPPPPQAPPDDAFAAKKERARELAGVVAREEAFRAQLDVMQQSLVALMERNEIDKRQAANIAGMHSLMMAFVEAISVNLKRLCDAIEKMDAAAPAGIEKSILAAITDLVAAQAKNVELFEQMKDSLKKIAK